VSDVSDLVLILTTVPADDRAEAIARVLVDERLAACVNVQTPMTSLYRWKGVVEQESERQLVIKTLRARTEQVKARLRELHPYELPEWIVMPVAETSPEYLEWVRAETAAPDISSTR
jgi:periplasmic divalent cation tolerance protein